MYTEIWHTCFFYLTKRFYEKILFEPDHIARKLFCNEHVKIKIFISKKEILSIQNDGYLIDKMAKNVIMNKDCTLWRNDASEKKQKGVSGTDTDPAVWIEYDRSDRDVHSLWYMDRQKI